MLVTKVYINIFMLLLLYTNVQCHVQVGPDPWDLKTDKLTHVENEPDIPLDLRTSSKKKIQPANDGGAGDWFYKRILAIVLKAGQVKINEDSTVDVALQMKFNEEQWQLLNGYTAINTVLTEQMIRRSLGLVEEAIYKPTIIEKAVVAWSDYIQFYLSEFKMHITWTLGIIAFVIAAIWFWKHMSHRHIYLTLFIGLYLYEVFTSYKEAEKEELQTFLSAVNHCKWLFWSSHCDVPPPDPLIFIKHMNPLKIGIRMFATVITEPIVAISETVRILIHGITDGLWFPLDKIVYGFLILNFNIIMILFLIMIVFNYILNIPFSFSFLGLFNIGLKQRSRSFNTNITETQRTEDADRISGATLNRLLDVCSLAISTAQSTQNTQNLSKPTLQFTNTTTSCRIRRSASTGRLPNAHSFSHLQIENTPNLSSKRVKCNGSGDGYT